MTDPFAVWMTDTVQLSTRTAGTFSAPAPLACWVEDDVQVVNTADGTERTSTRAVHTSVHNVDRCTLGSRVTFRGWESVVLAVAVTAYGEPTDNIVMRLA